MKQLTMSSKLLLPAEDAATQTYGFVARKGAGKTYACGVLVEELLDLGCPVVILDPIGNWYGLRLAADGKSAGHAIVVLGGHHGDVPLEPDSGKIVADLVVDNYMSAVLDVSLFSNNERKRFVTAFAEQLYRRAQHLQEPIMLVFEEAQVFAPQRVIKGDERLLGAVEKIVRLGRNYGLGSALITQRPQSVNKEVLNQVECLFVGQTNGSQERKAIEKWIIYQGEEADNANELPALPVGTMLVWSPQWLKIFKKVKIRKKRTFDASATPKLGHKKRTKQKLTPVDIAHLKTALASTIEKAQQDDPALLRRKIVQLERELKKQPAAVKPVRFEVPVVDRAALDEIRQSFLKVAASVKEVGSFIVEATGTVDRVEKKQPRKPFPKHIPHTKVAPPPDSRAAVAPPSNGAPDLDALRQLKAGARRMIGVLASFYPGTMTRAQIARASKMKITGGTFSTYWSVLRKHNCMVEKSHDLWEATAIGLEAAGVERQHIPDSVEGRVEFWNQRLKGGERRMLQVVVDQGPIERHALAAELDMTASGGTFSTYLSNLCRNRLVDKRDDTYVLHEWLLGGG